MATGERGAAGRRAYEHIRRGIIAGNLTPGTMLSENDLARDLGVSRTPVRTALGRLQEEGWVVIYPQRGALVRGLTAEEIREAAQVRHALETAGVRRAEPSVAPALLEALRGALDEQRAALSAGDFGAFNDNSRRFHRRFVELADNATMLALYDRLQDRQTLSIAHSARAITENSDAVLADHRELVDHAASGDWVAFADLLERHQADHHEVRATASS